MKDMMRKLMMLLVGKRMMSKMMTKTVTTAMTHLHNTSAEEYSCDEAFDVLDTYAEMIARGEDPSELMPLVKLHLEMCDNCREEFEALLSMLSAT